MIAAGSHRSSVVQQHGGTVDKGTKVGSPRCGTAAKVGHVFFLLSTSGSQKVEHQDVKL